MINAAVHSSKNRSSVLNTASNGINDNRHRFAIIDDGNTRFAFPATEVISVQAKGALREECFLPCSVGSVIVGGRKWPVFGWTSEFTLLEHIPSKRVGCVCLSPDQGVTGIAFVSEIFKSLNVNVKRLRSVPEYVNAFGSPVSHWILTPNGLIPLTSAALMTHYIKRLIHGRSKD